MHGAKAAVMSPPSNGDEYDFRLVSVIIPMLWSYTTSTWAFDRIGKMNFDLR